MYDSQIEENLVYSSVDSPDIFRVRLIDSEASVRCGLKSDFDCYTIMVTSNSISLSEDDKSLYTWPLRYIRRYGCTKEGFSLEAGRKCASGEGLFSFITKDGNSIFQAVGAHINGLKVSRNLTDSQIPFATNFRSNNSSVQHIRNESVSDSNDDIKPMLPSTSPPLSSNLFNKSGYLSTNSSLLPSTKIPEPYKRHSVQTPKVVLAKKLSNNELKSKPTPPSKPPRKVKDQNDSNEPVFASREEVLGINTESTSTGSHQPINDDQVLYDEPGDVISQNIITKNDPQNKAPFCPSPPPVNQTVSKLTSVLRMMFSGSISSQVHHKNQNKDNKKGRSFRSSTSTSSSGNNSITSSPIVSSSPVKKESDYKYGHGSSADSKRSDNSNDVNNSSKSVNNSNNADQNDSNDHEYANIILNHSNNLNENIDNSIHSKSHTEHYVQNDCEYARVVKRNINNNTSS